MKTNNFQGDLTDVSAKNEALMTTAATRTLSSSRVPMTVPQRRVIWYFYYSTQVFTGTGFPKTIHSMPASMTGNE